MIEAGEIKKILEKNYNLKNQEFQHTKLELEHIKKLRIKEYEIESKELEQLKNMEVVFP